MKKRRNKLTAKEIEVISKVSIDAPFWDVPVYDAPAYVVPSWDVEVYKKPIKVETVKSTEKKIKSILNKKTKTK